MLLGMGFVKPTKHVEQTQTLKTSKESGSTTFSSLKNVFFEPQRAQTILFLIFSDAPLK